MATFNESDEWRIAVEIAQECYRLTEGAGEGTVAKSLRHTAFYLTGSVATLPAATGARMSHKFGTTLDEIRRLESGLMVAVQFGELNEADVAGIREKLATLADRIRTTASEAAEAHKAALAKHSPFMDMSDLYGLD